MELKFRKLRADEIDARIATVNKGGVRILLYKDARVDQTLLDETVGPLNWQRHHQMIGDRLYCTVSVQNPETGEWVEKQDVGTESATEKEKGQASDSFKRACFNFGIGRELYTAPEIFISKDYLETHQITPERVVCYDRFVVTDIAYSGEKIASVTIAIQNRGVTHHQLVFTNPVSAAPVTPVSTPVSAPAAPAAPVAPVATPAATVVPPAAVPPAPVIPAVSAPSVPSPAMSIVPAPAASGTIADDEVILIGNCKGKKFGEVKDTDVFWSFVKWAKGANRTYPDPAQQTQLEKVRLLERRAS